MWDLEIQPYSMCVAVCAVKPLSTIVDIDTPKWVVQLEARSPRRLAKPPCWTCFLRPRLSPHAPGGSPPHAVATSQQLQRLPPAPPRLGTPSRSVVGPGTPLPASSLAAATPAGISTPLHHQRARIFLAHVIWWRVPPLVQLNLEQVVQHQRVIRQRSQPRRTTCPPQRSSSSRLRAISSRPEPVR